MTINQHQLSLERKRNIAALHSQSWQTMPPLNIDSDFALRALLDHDNNTRQLLNQFDDSFEPISVVTPPKKRVKTDFSMYNNPLADYRHEQQQQQQLLNSLQQYDFTTPATSYNLQGISTGSFVGNNIHYVNENSNYLSPHTTNMHTVPLTARRPSFFNSSSVSAALAASEQRMIEEFEPLIFDNSKMNQVPPYPSADDSETCPDLCSSTRSLLDNGELIIQSSDSFKENGYGKAEIVTGDSNFMGLLPRSSNQSSEQVLDTESSSTSHSSSSPLSINKGDSGRFKPFHEEKWNFHFNELQTFKKEHNHCLVPHTYPPKPHLARWVKRQRRQYKLKTEGNSNSTMTEERINILNDIGFVWDSHEVVWRERFAQLAAYKHKCGHCRVPSYCKDCPQLASWVKCQRRQYKLFWEEGKASSMTLERIKLLNSIGFIWEVHPGRKRKEHEKHFQHLANILMDA
jgi:hypothetical protein